MTTNVGVLTEDPDFYLLLSHVLRKEGYVTILLEPKKPNHDDAKAASAIIVDCSNVIEMTNRCKLLRAQLLKKVPIIAFLAARDEAHYLGLIRAGVTECVVRPASPEFVLRSLASSLQSAEGSSKTPIVIDVPEGRITLDICSRQVSMGAYHAKLSPTEFRLLEKLLHLPGRVVSRGELSGAWPSGRYVSQHTLDVHISKLRKALRLISHDTYIRTVREEGFAISTQKSPYKT